MTNLHNQQTYRDAKAGETADKLEQAPSTVQPKQPAQANSNLEFSLEPVAYVQSLFEDKFAIARQAALMPNIHTKIKLTGIYNNPQAIKDIEGFSHLWLVSIFHKSLDSNNQKRLMIRPPRLGGNKKVGVFASRSPFRPNNIGLSLVKLLGVETDSKTKQVSLLISGCDLIDGTPIVDIKPYLPYADAPENTIFSKQLSAGYVDQAPVSTTAAVHWPEELLSQLRKHHQRYIKGKLKFKVEVEDLVAAVNQLINSNPQPAYKKPKATSKPLVQQHQGAQEAQESPTQVEPEATYGMYFAGLNLRWKLNTDGSFSIIECSPK